jgi:putative ABC transport system ATP-binding protein
MPSVIAHDLFHGVGGADLLDGVSIEAEAGSLTAVVGPSGSGKTTLLHLLAGLDRPRSGSVVLDGTPLGSLDELALTRLRRDRIGLLLPTPSMLPTVTMAENVALPLLIAQRPLAREAIEALLDRVGLGGRGPACARELSGDERQRAALARALAGGPAVLLCDEPADQLSSEEAASLLALLRDVARREGVAVVLFTRDAEAAGAVADRVYELEAGRVVAEGAAAVAA